MLRAYETFEPRKLDFAFITLQHCMDAVLEIHGDNNYSIRHIGKDSMLAAGTLPVRVAASEHALETYNLMEGNGRGDDLNREEANVGNAGNDDDDDAVQMIQEANIEAV